MDNVQGLLFVASLLLAGAMHWLLRRKTAEVDAVAEAELKASRRATAAEDKAERLAEMMEKLHKELFCLQTEAAAREKYDICNRCLKPKSDGEQKRSERQPTRFNRVVNDD